LFISTLIFGIANGFVEAACNPLITTMYPDQKIKRLSMFHVWFPGGIVIGGVVAYAITKLAVGQSWESHAWQIKMASMLIPLVIYGIMFIGRKFPATERAASGISMEDMFKECIRPAFLMFVVCMLMTAVTELGPQQWFPNILTLTTGVTGILFLIWITGLMAVGRNFAGLIVHNISPIALLICSAAFSLIGLYMISEANSAGPAFFSATLFAIGVCFFWPTMLGVVSERFPRTGALGLAIMGGAGMLASSFAQPVIGGKFDQVTQQEVISTMSDWKPSVDAWIAKQTKDNTLNTEWAELSKLTPATASAKAPKLVKFLGDVMKASGDMNEKGDTTQADLLKPAADAWALAQKDGGSAAIRQVVVLPIILLVVFISIFLYDKSKGGYQKQMLHQEQTEA
jgi:MFS family permease